MNYLPNELIQKILSNIKIKQEVKYIPYGDGEQNYTIFIKKIYPFNLVSKSWSTFFTLILKSKL